MRANPVEYVQRYGSSLKRSIELPTFVKEIKPPAGVILAADSGASNVYELEGDVYALNLVDLEREGLVEYRYLVKPLEAPPSIAKPNTSFAISNKTYVSPPYVKNDSNINLNLLNELYKSIDVDPSNNTISSKDAEKILSRVTNRISKFKDNAGQNAFLTSLHNSKEHRIDFNVFKQAFEDLLKL